MILVTGATGFVGRHLVRRLLGAGETVRCFCRPGSSRVEWLRSQPVEAVLGHLHDPESVAQACRGVRQIVHLAAPIWEVRDAVVEQFHRRATACLVAGAREAHVERVVTVSPLGCGTAAGLPFLRSCGIAEECLRGSGLPFTILQSSLMFGAGDRLIEGSIRLVRRTGLLVVPGHREDHAAADLGRRCRLVSGARPARRRGAGSDDSARRSAAPERRGDRRSDRADAEPSPGEDPSVRPRDGLGGTPLGGVGPQSTRWGIGTWNSSRSERSRRPTRSDGPSGFQPMPLVEGVAYQLGARRDADAFRATVGGRAPLPKPRPPLTGGRARRTPSRAGPPAAVRTHPSSSRLRSPRPAVC